MKENRGVFSLAFFVLGMEFIYWNMKWAGNTETSNLAWIVLSFFHGIIFVGLLGLIGFGLIAIAATLLEIRREAIERKEKSIRDKKFCLEREAEYRRLERIQLENVNRGLQEYEKEQRRAEAEKLVQAQNKSRRSAKAAARDAISDF